MKLSFRKRMNLSFAGVLSAGLMLAGYSAWNTSRLSASLELAVGATALKLDLMNALRQRVQEMAASQRAAWAYANTGDIQRVSAMEAKFEKAAARTQEQIAEFRPLLVSQAAKGWTDNIEQALGRWRSVAPHISELNRQRQFAEALAAMQAKTDPELELVERDAGKLVAQQREILAADRAAAKSARQQSVWLNTIFIAMLLTLGAMGMYGIRKVGIDLMAVVESLRMSSGGLASASTQLSSSSQTLADSASRQASSLQETSASSEEVHSMSEKNSANAEAASTDMIRASELISTSATCHRHLDEWAHGLTESSGRISRIIRVIDEVAFQTNILALNAAVEAARAGEAGLGFAVVAEEVRNLAHRCANAAHETTSLIEQMVSQTGLGEARLAELDQAIGHLTPVAETTRQRVEEVRRASQEQAKGLAMIGSAMTQVDKLTQQVAASAEECASASEELAGQASAINTAVEDLYEMAR